MLGQFLMALIGNLVCFGIASFGSKGGFTIELKKLNSVLCVEVFLYGGDSPVTRLILSQI